MFRLTHMVLAAMAFAGALVTGTASAQLVGDQVTGNFLFPNTSTVYVAGGTKTIANGTVFDFSDLAGVTATFGPNTITLTNTLVGVFTPSAFNGVDFRFLSGAPITSVFEDASSSPLFATGSVLTFSSNDIMVNLSGTCTACVGGEKIILNVNTAAVAGAVPEPASWAMMILGMGAIGFAMRRRIRTSETKFDNRIKRIAAGEIA